MQDRFKFRIWSNTQGKYLTDDDIWELTDGIVEDVYCLLSEIDYSTNDDVEQTINKARLVIEQCTGCRDCDDNLIYEGDIVSVEGWSKLFVVTFEDGKFLLDKNDCWFDEMPTSNIWVAGNIHEDADLLKGSKK